MVHEGLVQRLKEREVAALARAITLVENGGEGYEELLSALHPLVGKAHRIGITGPPGAGKSTLIASLVEHYRARGETVAVVAVDPTSPFSGGALLGDRIRMESLTLDPGVYIRSMASRGASGGLATTTREVCDVLDAFGFERVVVETVGVGQSELGIVGTADTAVLVLVPESGDGVQVLKAGVMEIADLYLVNKADRPGADRLVQEVDAMLGFRRGQAYVHVGPHHGPLEGGPTAVNDDPGWTPPVLTTVAVQGNGVAEVVRALDEHHRHLVESGELAVRRRERLARHTRAVVDRALGQWVWEERRGDTILAAAMDDVVHGRVSPYKIAEDIVDALRGPPT